MYSMKSELTLLLRETILSDKTLVCNHKKEVDI